MRTGECEFCTGDGEGELSVWKRRKNEVKCGGKEMKKAWRSTREVSILSPSPT